MKSPLTVKLLQAAAARFAKTESKHSEKSMYGVTDGKAVGTYLEHKFGKYLGRTYAYERGSSASRIDLPSLKVDMKTTSVRQPQSSCPYRTARQKIYGLGYSLLIFVYDKTDDHKTRTGRLNILHVIFVEAERTADYQMTRGIRQILENDGNADDLIAFMMDKNLPVEDVEANKLAEEILKKPPKQGYLTISSALQWRLRYRRVINEAGEAPGVMRLV